MWTRAELKSRAKISFKRNYWKCILISLLLILFVSGGGSGASSASSGFASGFESAYNSSDYDDSVELYDDTADDLLDDFNSGSEADRMAAAVAGMIFIVVFLIVFIVVMAIVIVLDAFIFNPLEVGCRRFFIRNLNENALVGNVGYAFDNNYKNIVKTMFFRGLYTVLW